MSEYKVPQDVEADDKLIGPFSFRQFAYLMVAGGLVALAVALFQLFPLLAIIPVPFVLFFLALALPLKKDQPMETYLAALVSYYLKPRNRVWMSGQRETTILITAPKVVEVSRTREITSEEATHRLSFLADIVDTGGYAIKGMNGSPMKDDLYAEASTATDIFEPEYSGGLDKQIRNTENSQHAAVMQEMQQAIARTERFDGVDMTIRRNETEVISNMAEKMSVMGESSIAAKPNVTGVNIMTGSSVTGVNVAIKPNARPVENLVEKPVEKVVEKSGWNSAEKISQNQPEDVKKAPKNSIIELANNPDYSVATIAKEAKRINGKDEGEVFISLH